MRKIFVPALVLVASALAGAGLALAEGPGAPPPDGPGMMDKHEGDAGEHGMHHRHPGAHLEGRLAFLRAELKIKPGQEAAWSDFSAAAHKAATIREEAFGTRPEGDFRELPVPARLDLAEKMLTSHLDALKAIKNPSKKLYDALDADQKKVADELFHGPMGMHG